jgi:hypothetical protein
MRFYDVDGIEMDVQDPKFYIDVDKYKLNFDAIEEMLSYAPGEDATAHGHCTDGEIGYSG